MEDLREKRHLLSKTYEYENDHYINEEEIEQSPDLAFFNE